MLYLTSRILRLVTSFVDLNTEMYQFCSLRMAFEG